MCKKVIAYSICLLLCIGAASDVKSTKKSWRDKDIRDMTDADMEHLLDEWEQNDEPLEPDELPEHLRPSPQIDISKLDASNPDDMLKMTKKGKNVMMFVDTDEDLSPEQANTIMLIWQTSLQNNHIIAERYPINTRRSIFMFREGSQAIDAKNYLLEQPELSHITLEGQIYYRNPEKQEAATAKLRELRNEQTASNSMEKKKSKTEL